MPEPFSRRDLGLLVDVLVHARRAIQYVDDTAMGEFIEDGLTSSAVLYCLLVLGEASKNLSDEARSSLADIDWATMARFRDLAIHHYHRTDLRQVWDIVVSDLPPLVRRLHGVVLEDEA